MKRERDCKIVQDLLPNYIEKLTSEETNKYIDEHLKECDDCTKVLENMLKDIEVNSKRRNEREVKYIKKYNSKLKRLKNILLIIILLVVIFLIPAIRNYVIINNIRTRSEKYDNSQNYYKKTTTMNSDGSSIIWTIYKKDKRRVEIKEKNEQGKMAKVTTYHHGEIIDEYNRELIDTYTEVNGEKTAMLNTPYYDGLFNEPPIETTIWERIVFAVRANIRSEEYDGKQCYKFSTKFSDGYVGTDYYEKETGLLLKSSYQEDSETIREYEFDNVDDSVFVQPDASEYKVIKTEE